MFDDASAISSEDANIYTASPHTKYLLVIVNSLLYQHGSYTGSAQTPENYANVAGTRRVEMWACECLRPIFNPRTNILFSGRGKETFERQRSTFYRDETNPSLRVNEVCSHFMGKNQLRALLETILNVLDAKVKDGEYKGKPWNLTDSKRHSNPRSL